MKAYQALGKVKQLSDEASRHVTRAKVMYKPIEGIFNIRSMHAVVVNQSPGD